MTIVPPVRNTLFYIKRSLGFILLLAMAAVFIFSGISKLGVLPHSTIESFEWSFIDLGVNSMTLAGILARLMIGLEFAIGLFLLFHIFLKSFTYPVTIAVLGLFIIYLLFLLAKQGNTGNCGCFGDAYAMKPLAAIWKNVAMLVVTIILIYIYPVKPYKNQEWLAATLGMAALVLPFVLNALSVDHQPQKVSRPINLDALYATPPVPAVELRKGKHIVAFMSLTCPHCKKAAYLMQTIHREHPEIPMYIVLSGARAEERNFFNETHADGVPHIYLDDAEAFMQLAGDSVPAIYWINNSVVERESNYFQLEPAQMKAWLKQ